jgi:hypothetical protein
MNASREHWAASDEAARRQQLRQRDGHTEGKGGQETCRAGGMWQWQQRTPSIEAPKKRLNSSDMVPISMSLKVSLERQAPSSE